MMTICGGFMCEKKYKLNTFLLHLYFAGLHHQSFS
jgi:hypothetical protein